MTATLALGRLLREPVTIEHRSVTGSDTYGSDQQGTASTTETRGHLEVWREKEDLVRADTLETIWRVLLPPDVQIDHTDRVRVQGHVLDVIGVRTVMHPRHNTPHHLLVRCTESVG